MGEVVLTTCRNPNSSDKLPESLNIQDLRTGTVLASLKNNSCDTGCVTLLGPEFIAAAQADSTTLHFWSWKKNSTYIKSSLPEKIGSLCASHDGTICVAGGVSGTIYVWETSSGTQLKSWEGHYKRVGCLAFTEDDGLLISGGDDAIVNIWNFTEIIAGNSGGLPEAVRPIISWSEHSLPITSIYCGFGGINGRIVTTSMDRTCKLWDAPSHSLLCSMVFPTGLTAACMDTAERSLFVGGMDGRIYHVDLFSARSITEEGLTTKDHAENVFNGHTQGVTSLSASFDGSLLVSGSLDGSVKVWDVYAKQIIKSYSNHKGAITNVKVILRPENLMESDLKIQMPLQTFKKYNTSDVHSDTVAVNLKRSAPSNEEMSHIVKEVKTNNIIVEQAEKVSKFHQKNDMQEAMQEKIALLDEELKTSKEENAKWRKVNNDLYGYCVNEIVNNEQNDKE